MAATPPQASLPLPPAGPEGTAACPINTRHTHFVMDWAFAELPAVERTDTLPPDRTPSQP